MKNILNKESMLKNVYPRMNLTLRQAHDEIINKINEEILLTNYPYHVFIIDISSYLEKYKLGVYNQWMCHYIIKELINAGYYANLSTLPKETYTILFALERSEEINMKIQEILDKI